MENNKQISSTEVDVDTNYGVVVGENYGTVNYNFANAAKMPSLIADIVRAMSNIDDGAYKSSFDTSISAFKPDEKIIYNSVIKYKEIINEHAIYYSHCQEILNILDDSNIGVKSKIFRCVRNWYLEAKGNLLKKFIKSGLEEIDIIRSYSDHLIDSVRNKIFEVAKANARPSVSIEEIEIGVVCFTCFCFMECKILEKPV